MIKTRNKLVIKKDFSAFLCYQIPSIRSAVVLPCLGIRPDIFRDLKMWPAKAKIHVSSRRLERLTKVTDPSNKHLYLHRTLDCSSTGLTQNWCWSQGDHLNPSSLCVHEQQMEQEECCYSYQLLPERLKCKKPSCSITTKLCSTLLFFFRNIFFFFFYLCFSVVEAHTYCNWAKLLHEQCLYKEN